MFKDQRDVDKWNGLGEDGLPKVIFVKKRWSCPHCHSNAPKKCCVTCTREMCEECISHDPSVGTVCGLCYDRKHHPEDQDN